MAISAFISYSHADEKALDRLHKHLAVLQREGVFSTWQDSAVQAGAKLDDAISAALDAADIFIALVSPDYLASQYCYEKEFEAAMARNDQGQMQIVPIILEPCDWLNSPLRKFKALPKDGLPISQWSNQNVAFLDIVGQLRRLAVEEAAGLDAATPEEVNNGGFRRLKLRRDFDSIEKSEFADSSYETIREYFENSCRELNGLSGDIRAKYETMSPVAFTCTVVNRALMHGGEAHITVRNNKQGRSGDISYIYQRFAEGNSSNGTIAVEFDEYNLFLSFDMDRYLGGARERKYSPQQVAEKLWIDFIKQAGIEYE